MYAELIKLASISMIFFFALQIALKKPLIFYALLISYFAITSLSPFNPSLNFYSYTSIRISIFTIYIEDFLALCGNIVFLLWSLDKKSGRLSNRFVVSTGLIPILIGIVCWSAQLGIERGFNFWREIFWTISILLYSLAVGKDIDFGKFGVLLVWISALLSGLFLAFGLARGFGTATGVNADSGEKIVRLLSHQGATLLAISLILILSRMTPRYTWLYAIPIGLSLIVSQQRTVLVAFALTFIANYILSFQTRKSISIRYFGLLFLLTLTSLISILTSLFSFRLSDLTSTNTFTWRIKRWSESFEIELGFIDRIFGSIFGPTEVTMPGRFLYTAHSLYVEFYETMGLVGIVFLLFLFVRILRSKEFHPQSLATFISLFFIFFCVNSISYLAPQTMFAIAGILLSRRER